MSEWELTECFAWHDCPLLWLAESDDGVMMLGGLYSPTDGLASVLVEVSARRLSDLWSGAVSVRDGFLRPEPGSVVLHGRGFIPEGGPGGTFRPLPGVPTAWCPVTEAWRGPLLRESAS